MDFMYIGSASALAEKAEKRSSQVSHVTEVEGGQKNLNATIKL